MARPRPAPSPRPSALRSLGPAREQPLRVLRPHAGAVVGDAAPDAVALQTQFDRHARRGAVDGPAVSQRVVDEVVQQPLHQLHPASGCDRGVEPDRAEVHAVGIGAGKEGKDDVARHLVQLQRLKRQVVARLVGQRQRQQLVHQVAGTLLAAGDAAQLRLPHRRISMRQAVFRQGPDAGQRGAKFVGDVAGELALGLDAAVDARHQAVHGMLQPRQVAGVRRDPHRRQIARMALGQGVLQRPQGPEVVADRHPQPPSQQQQQHDLRPDRREQQALEQVGTGSRGVPHDDDERHRLFAAHRDHPQRAAVVVPVRERRCGPTQGGVHAQVGVAADQAAVVRQHREEDALALVEEDRAQLLRRQAEHRSAVARHDVAAMA